MPDLKDGDTVTLVVVEEEEDEEEEKGGAYPASAASPPSSPSSAWPVTLHSWSYKTPRTDWYDFTRTCLVGGWPAFAAGMGLAVGDEVEFERVEGDCGGEGGENGPAQPFRPPSAATLRVRIRRAEVVRAWPRSATVKLVPSSVGPRGAQLLLSPAAFEALFPDCGAWMEVRVVLADGEEGEGGEAGGGGRSWTVRVRQGKSSSRSGTLTAGWPAFVREAFRGALEAGQVLELTREGDGRGGPGPAEVRVRVLPRASGLDWRRAEVALAWPRSATVKLVPSSVSPWGARLYLPPAAFQALFPDCGAWMDVRVVLADGEEGEGGQAGDGGRSWTVKVVRDTRRGAGLVDLQGARAPPGKSSHRPRSGYLSAGWRALVREAFRGELEAGQVLELTREGDGRGGPGRAEVRVRVLPRVSGLDFRRAEVALAWPRSGTVKVLPSSVGPMSKLDLPRAAFEALFPDCGAWMDVRVVLADGEEGEGGEAGGGGRSWTVTVRRVRAPPGKSSYRSGYLSAGWRALVREAFRGELEAGQFLELSREGDGQGGPGRAEVRVQVLPGASGLESTTL